MSSAALALIALTIAAAGAGVIAGTALTQPAPPTPAPVRLAVRPGTATRLAFTSTIDDPGRAVRDAAGWHTCLDLLAARLDGSAPPWTMSQLWAAVHAEYVAAFDEDHHRDCVCGEAAPVVTA